MIMSHHIDPAGLDARVINGPINANPWSRTLYVGSAQSGAADDGNAGLDRRAPLATLKQAITNARALDRILIAETHAETISTATALDVNVAGVHILGFGQGDRRPTFTLDTVVGSTFTVSAAGVLLSNVRLASGLDEITTLLTVTGADVLLDDLGVVDDATYQAALAINLVGADRVVVQGLRAIQQTAGAVRCILVGADDQQVIRNCFISGDYSTTAIHGAAAGTQILIDNNWLENLNGSDSCISLHASTTGRISRNRCRIATDVQTTWITAALCDLYENYGVNNDAETGKLIGTVSV